MTRLVGAFFFEHEWRSWSTLDAQALATSLREHGVDSIVSESDTLRDDLVETIRREGLRWWAAVSLFSDHANANAVFNKRPNLRPVLENGALRRPMEWYDGTIPSDRQYTIERLVAIEKLIRAHDLDGVVLDFARWPLHWELECRQTEQRPKISSYDDITLERFRSSCGVDVPTNHADEAAAWIRVHAWAEWIAFRATVITQAVADAACRIRAISSVPVGVFTVPLPPHDLEILVGQRLSSLGDIVDYVFPMTYHAILHRDPQWIRDIVLAQSRESSVLTVPAVQVDATLGAQFGADWGDPISALEWSEVVAAALESSGGAGLVAFPGSDLLRPDRRRALYEAVQVRA